MEHINLIISDLKPTTMLAIRGDRMYFNDGFARFTTTDGERVKIKMTEEEIKYVKNKREAAKQFIKDAEDCYKRFAQELKESETYWEDPTLEQDLF